MNNFSQYWFVFLVFFLSISILFSIVINWLFLRLSINLGSRNSNKDQIRWAASVKPSLGGFSFFIVFLISISFIGALPRENELFVDKGLLGLTAASTLGFLIGLADDAYNTNPLVKFIGQLTCSFILIVSDVYIHFTEVPALDFALTTFWVIGMMNSINMLDNMDAITSSISSVIIIGIVSLILLNGTYYGNFYLVMLFGVLGSLIGFLYFNWSPARIYMGDSGSQFLGVFLAGIGIMYCWTFKASTIEFFQIKLFIIPVYFFAIPILDTATVTIRRLMRKLSPFVGGKDHITHHSVYLGLSEKQTAVSLISLSGLCIAATYPLILGYIEWDYIVTFGYIFAFVILFVFIQLLYNKGAEKNKHKKS
jgi:UDP-GlcNAc:undecaprenyl-phosphate GlcNAc-1-phosphate transferase